MIASRRRVAAGVIALALAAAVIIAVVLLTGGPSVAPPATAAADVVPADALAYVNVSLDRGRQPVRRAEALAGELPGWMGLKDGISDRLAAMLDEPSGTALTGAARSWLGGEAAFAIVPGTGGGSNVAGTLVVLAARRPAALARFLARSASVAAGSLDATMLRRYPGGTVAAALDGFLVLGQASSVRAAIVADHDGDSLAGAPDFAAAQSAEPAGRVLDAYVPGGGIARLLGGRGGPLGALGLIAAEPGLQALSLALSPADGGMRLWIRSSFSSRSGGGEGAGFQPTLPDAAPAASGALLDVRDLTRVGPALLAAVADTGLAGGLPPLLTRLGAGLRAEGGDLGAVLALFTREAAVDVVDANGHPAVLVLARTPRPVHARAVLADATIPLEALFSSGSTGSEPLFDTRTVAGVAVHGLALGPGLQLDYAVAGHRILIGTSEGAISAALGRAPRLAGTAAFRSVLGTAQGDVSSLLFVNLSVLIGLGEQTNLLHGSFLGALQPSLRRVSAIGLRASHADHETTAELFLKIT